MTTLWYRQPAKLWTDALPIGNGRLGGMVFGGIHEERIALNDDTLWSGAPQDGTNPGAYKTLGEVRAFLAAGEYAKADEMSKRMMGPYTQSYLALGDLKLKFEGIGEVTSYRRELDMATGIARTTFSSEGTSYSHEVFCSDPDQVMVIRLTAMGQAKLNLVATLESLLRFTCLRRDGIAMLVKAPLLVDPTYYRRGKIVTDWRGEGMQSLTIVRAAECNGEVAYDGFPGRPVKLIIKNATRVTLLLSTATSFNGFKKSPTRDKRDYNSYASIPLNLAGRKSFETLRQTHVQDHAALFNRVSFSLQEGDSVGATPASPAAGESVVTGDAGVASTDRSTDELLLAKDTDAEKRLAELMFHYGRYLLIACSRPGTQPANLQGIWNEEMRAPWSGNFTININTQMNYWPAEPANLAECHRPLLDFIGELAVTGKEIAKVNYHADGWCAHHNADLWRNAAPVGDWGAPPADPVWAIWPMGGVWLCQHLWEHYAFGRDERYLREKAYPTMKEACRFVLSWLIEGPDGRLTTSPSTSPEHKFKTPDGVARALSIGTTSDLCLIHDLFTNTIEAATVLGLAGNENPDVTARAVDCSVVKEAREPSAESTARAVASESGSDAKLVDQLRETLNRLAKPRILPDGRVAEFSHDFPEEDTHHRHVSHLMGLHPGRQWTKDSPFFDAARKSLEVRGNASTGWSLAWKINLWARLLDGEQALDCMRILFTPVTENSLGWQGGVYLNLFDAHPPFQIDGNFGFTSGVCEMLLQSHAGELHLLPALPKSWGDGHVDGLRARGGVTVNMRWKGGQLIGGSLQSSIHQTIEVRTGSLLKTISLKSDEIFDLCKLFAKQEL